MLLGGGMKLTVAGLIFAFCLLLSAQAGRRNAERSGPVIRVYLINGKSGKPMPNWEVDLLHWGGGPWDSAVTDSAGMVSFRLPSPPPPRTLFSATVNVPVGKGVRYEFGACGDFHFCTADVLDHGATSGNYCRKRPLPMTAKPAPGVVYLFGRKVGNGEVALREMFGGAPGPKFPWSKLTCRENTAADWERRPPAGQAQSKR